MIDRFGKPILIDFGSLKRDISATETLSSLVFVQPRFSPPEQRSRNMPEKFYTDIFALAGTMYCALATYPPPSSEERSNDVIYNKKDSYVPLEQVSKIPCPPEARIGPRA